MRTYIILSAPHWWHYNLQMDLEKLILLAPFVVLKHTSGEIRVRYIIMVI